jgi:hypothetical protein
MRTESSHPGGGFNAVVTRPSDNAPHTHQNDTDDDEQLDQLIARDGPAQEVRPIGLGPLAVLEIRMDDARHGRSLRGHCPAAPVHGVKHQTQINRSPPALFAGCGR